LKVRLAEFDRRIYKRMETQAGGTFNLAVLNLP